MKVQTLALKKGKKTDAKIDLCKFDLAQNESQLEELPIAFAKRSVLLKCSNATERQKKRWVSLSELNL